MSLDAQTLPGGGRILVSSAFEEAGCLGVFTERGEGVSEPPFGTWNLSYSSGDDPARVARNRDALTEGLALPPVALGGQVHAATIARVGASRAGSGWDGPEGVIAETDGLMTAARRIPVAVATADCVPVLLTDGARVAAVHAGWRGTAAGIVDKAIATFEEPEIVRAAIGPAAGGCCYAVGADVALAVAAGTAGGAVTEERDGAIYLDLAASIAQTLRLAGVTAIEEARTCTIHEAERFFSHRRDGAPSGRQLAVAMRL